MAKNAEGKGSSGGIVATILVTLLAVGGGGGLGLYVAGDLKARTAEQKPRAEAAKAEEPKVPADSKIIAMAPIIANIGDPSTAWMRIEASLVVAGDVGGEAAKTLATTIAGDVAAYVKTVSLAQFEGASGFQALREDLNDRARVRGGTQVREIVIHGIIVE